MGSVCAMSALLKKTAPNIKTVLYKFFMRIFYLTRVKDDANFLMTPVMSVASTI